MSNRYVWINRVKLLACILVVLGHYLSGLILSGIIKNTYFLQWFGKTIYYFHVPLFFICSGYLYQNRSKVTNFKEWKNNVKKKAISLGVPYIFFSSVTLLMKIIFSSDVNNEAPDFLNTILFNPIAPYWYLYVLFFIFCTTKTIENKKNAKFYLGFSVILKLIQCLLSRYSVYSYIPYFIRGIINSGIWFVFGMYISIKFSNEELKLGAEKKFKYFLILFIASVYFSVLMYKFDISEELLEFIVGMMFCISIIGIIISLSKYKESKIEQVMCKYTMPIFLMHTIFASCVRIVLIKININYASIHIFLGLVSSIILPMIVAKICSKSNILNFVLYPNQVLKNKGDTNAK